uniref:Uncharacterized protein n=1 Tax=uncultured prokaryote TaxID=198431 RepID=A0A0H5Q625_9ZZZZ|nr:hypothetical protein [uncultured prokaryote]
MFRIRLIWDGVAGTPYYTNLYFSGLVQADIDAIGDNLQNFLFELSGGITELLSVRVEDDVAFVDPGTQAITGFGVAPDFVVPQPASVGEPLPYGVQGLIALNTGTVIGGRRIKGHIFIPGQMEKNSDSAKPSVALLASYQTAAEALIGASDTQLVVNSPKNFDFAVVTSARPSPMWSSLRTRRQQG